MTEERQTAWANYGTDQAAVAQWVDSRLGAEQLQDLEERSIRVLEEAIELYQAEMMALADALNGEFGHRASDISAARAKAHKLVDAVMDKPPGDPVKEGAGVLNTMLAWAAARKVRFDDIVAVEIDRIYKMSPQTFRDRQLAKAAKGLGLKPRAE